MKYFFHVKFYTFNDIGFRFCLKMIPVKNVCHASINDIKKMAPSIISPHFHADTSSSIEVSYYNLFELVLHLF